MSLVMLVFSWVTHWKDNFSFFFLIKKNDDHFELSIE
jgi:hypothetical protein